MAQATSDDERAIILRALGNTGDPRILPALTAAFSSSSVLVRIAAVEAMRLVPGAEGMIAKALADVVPDVRSAAVFAAADRDLNALRPALAFALQRDREITVRRSIIELAGNAPLLRPLLVDAAAHDSDRELRDLAKHLLDESGSA